MDKRKRRNKLNKNRKNDQASPATDVSGFDTSGLPENLKTQFTEADELIQSRFTTLTKQEDFLTAAKDQALREIDSCFDRIIQVITRRKQLLKSELSDMYTNQLEDILEKKESVLLSGMFLETLLRQAKEMSAVAQGERDRYEDMVQREIDRHSNTAFNALPDKNLIEFSKTTELLEPTERKLRMIGKLKAEYGLPSLVCVEDCRAVVSLPSKIKLNIYDALGERLPSSLIKPGFISFQLKDARGEFVQYRLDNNDEKNIQILFKPETAENLHLTVLFSSHILKEVEVLVNESSPSLVFGPEAGLVQPNALCSLKDGKVCIADSGASKLLLFSDMGELLAEAVLPEGGFVLFDITTDQKRNFLICTGSFYDEQDDTLSASPDDYDNPFPTEIKEENGLAAYPELPRDKERPAASGNANHEIKDHTLSSPHDTEDLNIVESEVDTVRLRYIEKRGYVTITNRNQIILGEVNSNAILMYNMEGNFLRRIPCPKLDCLGSVQCKPDGQLVVSDIGNCLLLAGTPEMGLCEQWGSVETASKQLLLPLGLALDHTGNLLVADGGEPKVFVYGEYGEFVGFLELGAVVEEPDSDHIANSPEGTEPESSASKSSSFKTTKISPWALTVIGGYMWVIDNNSHKVFRYNYSNPI